MEIKAIHMFDGGFMNQPFAFGGEEGREAFDDQIIYRSSLQNFLIDTGNEVILVDTGFKTGYAAPAKKLGAPLYMGEKVADYMEAFAATGYQPEQVTKILITHKHPDHSDCIGEFPNAKVYIAPEDADANWRARTSSVPSTASHTTTSPTRFRWPRASGSSRLRATPGATASSLPRWTASTTCSTAT